MDNNDSLSSHLLTKKDYRYFDVAKAIARTSNYHGTHVGCCVVNRGVVVSVGCNSEKTHPTQMYYNKYRDFDPKTAANKLHAETHALSLIVNRQHIDWNKTSIYVYREFKNGKPAISRPCEACSQLIKDLGISHVCYIDENGNYTKERWN